MHCFEKLARTFRPCCPRQEWLAADKLRTHGSPVVCPLFPQTQYELTAKTSSLLVSCNSRVDNRDIGVSRVSRRRGLPFCVIQECGSWKVKQPSILCRDQGRSIKFFWFRSFQLSQGVTLASEEGRICYFNFSTFPERFGLSLANHVRSPFHPSFIANGQVSAELDKPVWLRFYIVVSVVPYSNTDRFSTTCCISIGPEFVWPFPTTFTRPAGRAAVLALQVT